MGAKQTSSARRSKLTPKQRVLRKFKNAHAAQGPNDLWAIFVSSTPPQRMKNQAAIDLLEQWLNETPTPAEIEAERKSLAEIMAYLMKPDAPQSESGRKTEIAAMCPDTGKACNEYCNPSMHDRCARTGTSLAPASVESARGLKGVKIAMRLKQQRDECAEALRNLTAVVERNFPMPAGVHVGSPLDAARKALAEVPTYGEQLRNIFKGAGYSDAEFEAAMRAHEVGR
jgi:hypothetical protein